ncbi:Crp/Fnr family transcriptional regulator [Lacibacterium aquatile]|uniref:Crp/Fnr family transcriptional regulator n=1 Tax=Lacibacterium aquatile TaxID=1168082 RepID=A0ABW5DV22_9PROT
MSRNQDLPLKSFLSACTTAECQDCDARPHSVCAGVPEHGIADLEANVTHMSVEPRGAILMEGDPAHHMFNVTSGTVRVYKLLPDGRRQVIGFLMTGDFLGFAVRDAYAYSAEAVTEVSLCRFSRPRMEALLQKFPGMEKRLLGLAANELAIAQDLMLLLGRKTARERLASFFLMMVERLTRLGRTGNPLPLPMSRSDIADYLGLTTETVSRAFTQFRNDGLIALEGTDTVRLTDLAGLQEIADGN